MKVKIYGRSTGCKWCDTAKEVCASNNLDYEFIDLATAGIDGTQLAVLCGKPVRTVPQIFVDDVHVGGCTEFINGLRDGEFQ